MELQFTIAFNREKVSWSHCNEYYIDVCRLPLQLNIKQNGCWLCMIKRGARVIFISFVCISQVWPACVQRPQLHRLTESRFCCRLIQITISIWVCSVGFGISCAKNHCGPFIRAIAHKWSEYFRMRQRNSPHLNSISG